jgi:uncharacterized membrane protein
MDNLAQVGKWLFAVSIAVFSVQLFIYASSMAGPVPAPPWDVESHDWGYVLSIALIAASIGLVSQRQSGAAAFLAALILARVLLIYMPSLAANIREEDNWTNVGELLAMCGASLMLTGRHRLGGRVDGWENTILGLVRAGRVLFAVTLVVFGVEHFVSARGVAGMIPSWVPAPLFWAYFVGVAFFAAAAAIITNVQTRLAAMLLGAMFLVWVLVLWAPGVVAAPGDGGEWTNTFVTLAMSGGAWVLAGESATPVRAVAGRAST